MMGAMLHLVAASILWSFSFGLIKHFLVTVDAELVAAIRLLLSFLVFAPFLRRQDTPEVPVPTLLAIGALQFGVMYIAYIRSYRYLAGHEVAILTVLTPLYVTLIHDAWDKRFHAAAALAAAVAVVGAGIIVYRAPDLGAATLGVVLHQVSSASFATGQVWYRRLLRRMWHAGARPSEASLFAWLYLGGFLVALVGAAFTVDVDKVHLTGTQVAVLLYLGILPSGLGFFLWNTGAARVRPGTLAAMNNLKIPLAVAVALLVFGETADPVRLVIGGLVIAGAVAGYERWGHGTAR